MGDRLDTRMFRIRRWLSNQVIYFALSGAKKI